MDCQGGAFVISRIDRRIDPRLLSVSPMRRQPLVDSKRLSVGLVILAVFAVAPMWAMPHSDRHEVRHQIENLEKAWCNAVLHANVTCNGWLAGGRLYGHHSEWRSPIEGTGFGEPQIGRGAHQLHRFVRSQDSTVWQDRTGDISRRSCRHQSRWRFIGKLPVYARVCDGCAWSLAHRQFRSQQNSQGPGPSFLKGPVIVLNVRHRELRTDVPPLPDPIP